MLIIALTATALSIEIILVINTLLSHVPVKVDIGFVHSIIWHYQRNFEPQRNIFIYLLWLVLSTALFAALCWAMKFGKHRAKWDLKPFLLFHIVIVCLMSHANFEVVAVGNPFWAWPVFWVSFAAGVLISIFWPEFVLGLSSLKRLYAALRLKPWVGQVAGSLLIFLVIFMPDLQAVVAMDYMGDYFHNWDIGLFPAVYAIAHGAIPCVDVYVTYGLGACVMLAKLVNLMGGFDYARVLSITMWVGIIYFVLWFLLLKRFLASGLLAFAAVVCAMRMHIFNSMTEPMIWVEVASSIFRFCFDVGVFWMLWMHIQTRRTFYLAAGAFLVSLAIFHMVQMGIYIFVVFGLYACASAFVPCLGGRRDPMLWRNHALAVGSVFVLTFLWFYMTVGTHLFEGVFLRNLMEYSRFFIQGGFVVPLSTSLLGGNPVSNIGGLLYPVFCMVTFFFCAGQVITAKARERDVFAGLLALYALETHSYYMVMVTEWYTMGIFGLFLLFYWIDKALENVPVQWRRRIEWGIVVAALYCLMTTRLFIGYPNLLNISRNPIVDSRTAYHVGGKQVRYFHQLMVDYPEAIKLPLNSLGNKDEELKFADDFADDNALKAYYAQQTAWPEDTAMIRRLTPEGAKVPVISSFELLFLQRADRQPFFYYFPLINSRPLTVRNFMVTYLFYYPQLQKTLDQLETQKPEYIFMERIFLTPQVPQVYFYEYDDLISLLRYVFSKYEPAETGKYLVAMKRKAE